MAKAKPTGHLASVEKVEDTIHTQAYYVASVRVDSDRHPMPGPVLTRLKFSDFMSVFNLKF